MRFNTNDKANKPSNRFINSHISHYGVGAKQAGIGYFVLSAVHQILVVSWILANFSPLIIWEENFHDINFSKNFERKREI